MSDPLELRRFHVLATLAEGPYGATYKVLDPGSGELLVARQFVAHIQRDAPALGRLGRDVAVAMRLAHPALAPWRLADGDARHLVVLRPWIAAPSLVRHPRFSVGADPKSWGGQASGEELRALARGALEALEALHQAGLLARRITPANVFLDEDGGLQLTDWGVRFPVMRPGWADERTPRRACYLAPEVAAGRAPDRRADLYSLGVLLYQLATGHMPQVGAGGADEQLQQGGELGPLVRRLLAAEPTARPASAAEALAELGSARGRAGERSAPLVRSERLVGREAVLGELAAAIDRAAAGQGDLVFLRGVAGCGKTRLLEEAARHAAVQGMRVLSAGPTEPSGYVFGRLTPCFEEIARDMASAPADELRELLGVDGRILLELSPAFHELPGMRELPEAPLLGSEASRRRLLRVAARALACHARRQPLLLLLDDVESADPLSLEFTRYLARRVIRAEGARRSPLLLLAAYRDTGDASAAKGALRAAVVALRAKGLAREVVLRPLAPHEVRDLLLERLGDALPGGFVAKVLQETDGSPLEIEETLAWLESRGVLARPPGEWTESWEAELARARAQAAPVPSPDDSLSLLLGTGGAIVATARPSIAGLRLRELGPDPVRLLETVALAGDGVRLDVLEMASGLGAAFASALVETLAAGGLVEAEPETVSFRQAQAREALAGGLSSTRRRAVHQRIGIALEQHVGRLDDRTPLLLAHHFHESGDVERSLLYLPLAARIFKDRHAPNEALVLFRRFFRHLQVLEPAERERHLSRRLQALQSMAESLAESDRKPDAVGVYREMAALADGTARERELVAAWSGLARLSLGAGELDAALDFAARAAELARSRDLAIPVADNMRVLGLVAHRRQRLQDAVWHLSGALKIYQEQGDQLGAARALEEIGDVYEARYDHRRALASYRKSHRHYRALDDKVGVSSALNKLGRVHLNLGDASRALAYHREALRLEREADDREGVGLTLDLLGEAYRQRGDLHRAEEACKEALALKRELADVRGSADSLVSLAHVRLMAGAVDEATNLLEQALTLSRRTGNARAESSALVRLAQARMHVGEQVRARELAEDGRQRAEAAGDRALECRALLVLAWTAEGDAAMAFARRAEAVAAAVGLKELQFRAHARLGELLEGAGQAEQALEHYRRALDVASALVAAARSARDGFLRRSEVIESLRAAVGFVAGRDDGDVVDRYPVLQYARELLPQAV